MEWPLLGEINACLRAEAARRPGLLFPEVTTVEPCHAQERDNTLFARVHCAGQSEAETNRYRQFCVRGRQLAEAHGVAYLDESTNHLYNNLLLWSRSGGKLEVGLRWVARTSPASAQDLAESWQNFVQAAHAANRMGNTEGPRTCRSDGSRSDGSP